jgi:hypothetical protein
MPNAFLLSDLKAAGFGTWWISLLLRANSRSAEALTG